MFHTTSPTILALVALLGAVAVSAAKTTDLPYCQGPWKANHGHCKQFTFTVKASGSDNPICPTLPANVTNFPDLSGYPTPGFLTDSQKHVIQAITNVFENSEEAFTYAACEDIGDARGYTCGRIGFTTGTGDIYALFKIYQTLTPTPHPIIQYLPELARLDALPSCDADRASTAGLPDFVAQWKDAAATDPFFREAQDLLNESMYLTPGRTFAASEGVVSPLGQALFYDTIIQTGWQRSEPDINLMHILDVNGHRRARESEAAFLDRFLATRRHLLCCDVDTAFPGTAGRVSDLQEVLAIGDFSLYQNIFLRHQGITVNGTKNYD